MAGEVPHWPLYVWMYTIGCLLYVFFTFLNGEPKKVAQFKLPLKGECVKD